MAEPQFSDLDNEFNQDETGDLKVAEDAEAIETEIENILNTKRGGGRMWRPEIGSRLRGLIFEPMDAITEAKVREELITVFDQIERAALVDFSVEDFPQQRGRLLKIVWDAPLLVSFQKTEVLLK